MKYSIEILEQAVLVKIIWDTRGKYMQEIPVIYFKQNKSRDWRDFSKILHIKLICVGFNSYIQSLNFEI